MKTALFSRGNSIILYYIKIYSYSLYNVLTRGALYRGYGIPFRADKEKNVSVKAETRKG